MVGNKIKWFSMETRINKSRHHIHGGVSFYKFFRKLLWCMQPNFKIIINLQGLDILQQSFPLLHVSPLHQSKPSWKFSRRFNFILFYVCKYMIMQMFHDLHNECTCDKWKRIIILTMVNISWAFSKNKLLNPSIVC